MPCGGGQHRVQPPPGDQGDGRLDQDIWGTQVPSDGQRIGVHRQDPGSLVEGSGSAIQVHRSGVTLAERAERAVQRHLAEGIPEPGGVPPCGPRQGFSPVVCPEIQHRAAAQQAEVSATAGVCHGTGHESQAGMVRVRQLGEIPGALPPDPRDLSHQASGPGRQTGGGLPVTLTVRPTFDAPVASRQSRILRRLARL